MPEDPNRANDNSQSYFSAAASYVGSSFSSWYNSVVGGKVTAVDAAAAAATGLNEIAELTKITLPESLASKTGILSTGVEMANQSDNLQAGLSDLFQGRIMDGAAKLSEASGMVTSMSSYLSAGVDLAKNVQQFYASWNESQDAHSRASVTPVDRYGNKMSKKDPELYAKRQEILLKRAKAADRELVKTGMEMGAIAADLSAKTGIPLYESAQTMALYFRPKLEDEWKSLKQSAADKIVGKEDDKSQTEKLDTKGKGKSVNGDSSTKEGKTNGQAIKQSRLQTTNDKKTSVKI